jgi:hypothetical protein
MIVVVRNAHSDHARESGLAGRIRRQRLEEDPELRREGGRHRHRLEELLTRRERQRPPPIQQVRDDRGRFVGGRLAPPVPVVEHDPLDRLIDDKERAE